MKERFLSKVEKQENGCWLWTAASSKKPSGHNYGLFSCNGKLLMAHRVAFELFGGKEIEPGFVIDHICRNTLCVNPEHLEEVTPAENTNRGRRASSEKTHCPQGHEYSGENLFITTRGHRECRICRREKARESEARRQARRSCC